MDRSILTRITAFIKDPGLMTARDGGRIPTRVRFIIGILDDPRAALVKQQRLKDLLFPDDLMPEHIDRAKLADNLRVLERDEGVALVLSDDLLFDVGESRLKEEAGPVLEQIALVLSYMSANVNVSGHSDATGGRSAGNFALSGHRALSVLDYFLDAGLDARRLSVAAYGPDRPVADDATEKGRAANRRVEILVKTSVEFGSYS